MDKKSELLMTLKHPEVPLHNNESELGARAQVRRRDVSLHTMTEDGTKANDNFLTIVETAKKLDVLVRMNISMIVPASASVCPRSRN